MGPGRASNTPTIWWSGVSFSGVFCVFLVFCVLCFFVFCTVTHYEFELHTGIAWPVAIVACLFVVMVPSIITSMASRAMWHSFDSHARKMPSSSSYAWNKKHDGDFPSGGEGYGEEYNHNAPFYALRYDTLFMLLFHTHTRTHIF